MLPLWSTCRSALDGKRHALTTADTQGGQAFLGVTGDHLVDQADQDTAAGGSDRVTDSDSATVDVDLGGVPAQFLVDGK